MQTNHKHRTTAIFQVVDQLNNLPIMGVIKDDDVARPDAAKMEGDFRNEDVIPLLINRFQAMPVDFDNFQKHSALSAGRSLDEDGVNNFFTGLVRGLGPLGLDVLRRPEDLGEAIHRIQQIHRHLAVSRLAAL